MANAPDARKTRPGQPHPLAVHPNKDALIKHLVLGDKKLVDLGKMFGVHVETIYRFRTRFVTEEVRRSILAKVRTDAIVADTGVVNDERLDIARTYDKLARRVEAMITKAEESDDAAFALAAMEGLRKVRRDIATMQGKLAHQLTVDIKLSEAAEWVELRGMLIDLCEEVPAAREPLLRMMRFRSLSVAKEAGGIGI